LKKIVLHSVFLLFSVVGFAQISVKVDTTHIRIGEQIQYEISTENQAYVKFPKLETDSLHKIEVLHDLPVDTIKNRLYKKYILTSFDSGVYTLPAQKVLIDRQHYLTDSLLIHVGTVAVDTTKQGLFPIKDIYKAPPKTWRDYIQYLWWLLALIVLLSGIFWLIFTLRKSKKRHNQILLSPIEEATGNLENLDKKQLIEQQKIKEYYVELTDIVRSYIGKDVNIPTLEVTTDELITLLELHNKSKQLGIDKERIKELHTFLQNADLVKFAKARPEETQIKDDRRTAEQIIKNIQEIIHRPKLDEFGNEIVEISPEEIQAKTRKKRRRIVLISGLVTLLVLALGSVSYFGYTYVVDTITGHPTKKLLESTWYRSNYGYPAVTLETPEILKATATDDPTTSVFSYGSLTNGFLCQVTTSEIASEKEVSLDMIVENSVQMIQNQKGISGFNYDEAAVTNNDIEGKKITGNFRVAGQELEFNQFIYSNDSHIQSVLIVYKKDDSYAKKIAGRITQSIELQKISNDDDDEN